MSIYDTAYQKLLRELRTARQAAGLSQDQLATRLGKHQTFVSKIEKGQRYLDVLEFVRWASAVKLDAAVLIAGLQHDLVSRSGRIRKTLDPDA